jgi:hypothetical protein
MGTLLWILVFANAIAFGQSADAVNDLERRALASLEGIRRAETWNQVLSSRGAIRTRLEQSLNLSQSIPDSPHSAFLYLAKASVNPGPVVLLLRPHSDPAALESRLLPSAIAKLGISVFELDAGAQHSTFNRLAEGLLPQTLIQRDVRSAIAYLRTRTEVDMKRLVLIGQGLAATTAAAINPEFSAVVLLDGAPDFKSIIETLRVPDLESLDSCALLPGILRYAATEELLTLIAPRPLLLLHPADRPLAYVTELYRWSAGVDKLQFRPEKDWVPSARFATYSWLARWADNGADLIDFREPQESLQPNIIPLQPLVGASASKLSVSPRLLSSLLGDPLPEGSMSHGLNCHGNQQIDFYPQAGLKIPATALRPGPDACDASRGTLIAVDDRGRSAMENAAIVQEAIRQGWVVWLVDPRGIGELKTPLEPFVFAVSLLLGENFTWRQSTDILRILRHVARRSDPTGLYARGKNMSLAAAYVAAVADRKELQWVILEDAAVSFRQITDLPLSMPFNAVRSFDITDLFNAAQIKPELIKNPQEFLQRDW